MKKLLLTSVILATLVVTGTSLIKAQTAPAESPSNEHRLKPRQIKKELNLTDDQVAKIKAEFASQKESLKTQAIKVRDARLSLRNAIQSGAPEATIRSAAANVGTAMGDLAMVRATLFAHIKPILTPEQLEKFQTLQASHELR